MPEEMNDFPPNEPEPMRNQRSRRPPKPSEPIHRHNWIAGRGGRERCSSPGCGAEYPCRFKCNHVDCLVDKGMPMPEWITYVPSETA